MAQGDPNNVAVWGDADIYVSFDLNAATPADINASFSAAWHAVGILDGAAGIVESSTYEQTDTDGWGWGTVRTGYSKFKRSWKFTAIEDNDLVWRLRHPNSTAPNISSNSTPEQVLIAYEIRDGVNVRRKITTGYATITVDGDRTISETGASSTPFLANIFGDDDQNIFVEQPANVGS